MKQRYYRFIFMLIFVGFITVAASSEVIFNIQYFDKKIYYVQGSATDPIFIQMTIINNSPSTFHFKLSDERVFSVDFDVRTMTNQMLEPADVLIRKRSTSQQVFFREISIEPGESFSFIEDIRNYVDLKDAGIFMVKAKMYPQLYRTGINDQKLESNRLSLSLRPFSILGPDGIPLEMDADTNAILVREKLSPDKVVEYLLQARQKEQWEKFFLYLDLEALVSRDSVRQRQWQAESQEGRQRMLARYRLELQSATIDGDIATIPMDFQIERTSYSVTEGTVVVQERFKVGTYVERKRYTYYLQRKDDIWTIVDYSVVNLGTD
ncbi:MAG: hypothetical protein LBB43_02630 [Spirochaetaceae bacterium]|nr:hypothetical protein [Spirochaetaceae bacterium]